MLGLFFGFAQIAAEDISDGIAPKDKRQIVGTGVTTSSAAEETTTATTMSSAAPTSTEPTSAPETTSQASPTSQPTSEQDTPTSAEDPSQTPGGTTAQSPTSEAAPETTTIPTSIEVTTTNSAGSVVTSRIATSVVSTGRATTSDLIVVGSSTINRSTLSQPTTITSALVTSRTEQSTYTSYFTSNGVAGSSVYTTQRVVEETTGFATATVSPSIQDGGGSGSGGGLSASSRRIVGGVVGGIGGAILVGGIALVAWRLWGKKKRAAAVEKEPYTHSASDSFDAQQRQSTQTGLERYHNPGGQPNTASNF